MSASKPISAGFIYYKQTGTNLAGIWSHENEQGKLCRETVTGASLGALGGTYPVEIWDSNGKEIYVGTLSFESIGVCHRLTWDGKYLGTPMTFVGIGHAVDDLFVASFEPAGPSSAAAA